MDPQLCPWDQWQRATMQFCEANLCELITQPANSWSNLGCVIGAVLLWRQSKTKSNQSLAIFAGLSCFLGVSSFIFHATNTMVGEFLDLFAMFLLVDFILALSLQQQFRFNNARMVVLFAVLSILSFLFPVLIPNSGTVLFALLVLSIFSLEGIRFAKTRQTANISSLLWSLAWLICAFTAWILDYTHMWCNPNFHAFSGHALWHLGAAVSIYFAAQFFAHRPINITTTT